MKKMNEKGFILVETIIVAVFIMGLCAFIFANIFPLIGDLERIENYDEVEVKYGAHEIRKMVLREIVSDNSKVSILTAANSSPGYTNDTYQNFCNKMVNKNYCNKLLGPDFLNVTRVFITKYRLTDFKSTVAAGSFDRDFKEYIKYLPSYNKYSDTRYDCYFRLIAVYADGRFANIEVRLTRNSSGVCIYE